MPSKRVVYRLLGRLHFPDPMVLLVGCIFLAAIATHLVPAGSFDREVIDGREMEVAGTFHSIEPQPLGLFETFVALPLGMIEAAASNH